MSRRSPLLLATQPLLAAALLLLLFGSERDDSFNTFNSETFLYDLSGNLLETLTNPTPGSSSGFGSGIAFDSGMFAIGAGGGMGQAHIYAVPEPPGGLLAGLILASWGVRRRQRCG